MALEQRVQRALSAIRRAYGTASDTYGATLFVSHHLEDVPADYWRHHLGTPAPEPTAVLGLLQLCGDPRADQLDFSLPGDITDYVISVRFDHAGQVIEICMES